MAVLSVPDENRVLREPADIAAFLSSCGIWYRRFAGARDLGAHATQEEILAAYEEPVRELMAENGYTTADVINVTPDMPGLDQLLAQFSREHWHAEDEVRFVVRGRGVFHIAPEQGPVSGMEMVQGDMINVPRRTRHWFHLCEERTIQAIRLFQDPAGWAPRYTDSGIDSKYQPLCLGPTQIGPM
jgi:1,2-dihydroxy-3-keto-5-methylthiopentene dioxygenase